MTNEKKTPKWILALVGVALLALGIVIGSLNRKDPPKAPVAFPVGSTTVVQASSAVPVVSNTDPEADPPEKDGEKPSADPESASIWRKTVLDADLMGAWEGPEHKPLPEVKIAKPHPERKFKAQPPDFNIKFRIPIKGSGLYEGGCDTYVSGKAFCRIHDPADKPTYRTGKRVEGLVITEVKGDSLRLNVPNGVVVELVRRPEKKE